MSASPEIGLRHDMSRRETPLTYKAQFSIIQASRFNMAVDMNGSHQRFQPDLQLPGSQIQRHVGLPLFQTLESCSLFLYNQSFSIFLPLEAELYDYRRLALIGTPAVEPRVAMIIKDSAQGHGVRYCSSRTGQLAIKFCADAASIYTRIYIHEYIYIHEFLGIYRSSSDRVK